MARLLAAAMIFGSAWGVQDGKGRSRGEGAKVGDPAPDWKVKTLADAGKEIQLSGFKEKKLVCLIFGSYT